MSWKCGGLSVWLLPEQLPLPFPQSDGSAVDVHINMEQAPIQVSRGLGGSGKGIWEKEAMRLGLNLTEEMGPGSLGCGAHGFISNLPSYFLCCCRVSPEYDW